MCVCSPMLMPDVSVHRGNFVSSKILFSWGTIFPRGEEDLSHPRFLSENVCVVYVRGCRLECERAKERNGRNFCKSEFGFGWEMGASSSSYIWTLSIFSQMDGSVCEREGRLDQKTPQKIGGVFTETRISWGLSGFGVCPLPNWATLKATSKLPLSQSIWALVSPRPSSINSILSCSSFCFCFFLSSFSITLCPTPNNPVPDINSGLSNLIWNKRFYVFASFPQLLSEREWKWAPN